ncbi:MAG: SDR family oxidoreductase [Deltaproteobacteria bacterium]|nr:SDR family oxidoreductase [Deltaproteobacteria bacterium]MDQ3296574.1 SDR family oxidoreductase [Myxococcota bacterium]
MTKLTALRLATGLGTLLLGRALIRRRRHLDLRDKVVVITGGSRGLGLVLARELVRKGARVAICARDAAELERARVELAIVGGTVHAAPCDVTDRDDITRFLTEVHDELGPIDVLFNNAGIIQVGPVEMMNLEDYERAMRTHLWAPLYAMLAVLPEMRRRGSGRVVNITSIGAKLAIPHLVPYCASKFALYGLSSGMRTELAQDGVFITTVCPGLMRTGSPRHAIVKGQAQAEYAWFDITDSSPVTSMNAERAARQIIRACEHGDAEVVLSLQGRLAAKAHALAPNLVQEALAVVARLMPSSEGGSRVGVEGKDAESALAPSVWTAWGDAAARRNNEV